MKVVGQRVFVVNAARTNFIFVKLYTDAGIDGVGEGTLEWRTKPVVAALEEVERFIVGKDPFAVEFLIETMHRDSYWRTGAVFRTALGAIEAALLDIKGKALGVPVYELLGGKHRDRVKCYANHWFYGAETPDDYAAAARRAVAGGFRALKWDPFGSVWLEMDRRERGATIANVEAVRAAVGPDIDLMIDVHGRLNVPTAITMARALERYDIAWMEEPTPPESIDALADVRARSPVPIAAGERFFEPERFLEAITKRAVDILQPDVGHAGGMLETKKIAGFAHTRLLASRVGEGIAGTRWGRARRPHGAGPWRGARRGGLREVSVQAAGLADLHRQNEHGRRRRWIGGRLAPRRRLARDSFCLRA